MAFPKRLNELCTPAFLYFVFSVMGIIMVIIQNIGNSRTYSLGFVTTRVTSTTLVFMVKILFILFWTWVLNLICKDGHSGIAWLLVLFPFILLFVVMALVMINPVREGYADPWANAPKKQPSSDQSPNVYAGLNAQTNELEADQNNKRAALNTNISNDQNNLIEYQNDLRDINWVQKYAHKDGDTTEGGENYSALGFFGRPGPFGEIPGRHKNQEYSDTLQANGQPFAQELDANGLPYNYMGPGIAPVGTNPYVVVPVAQDTAYGIVLTDEVTQSITDEQKKEQEDENQENALNRLSVFPDVHATSTPNRISYNNNLPKIHR